MKKGYYFPPRNGGIKDGINDSGIETFKGTPLYSMTKETIQNSLDARKDVSKPVVLEFKKTTVDIEKVPYVNEFEKILESCYLEENNKKTKDFFQKSLDIIKSEKINILEIADYNTVGLKGAKEENSPFNDLVKSVGVSNKDSSSGGSFGIGKNAPFACTRLRTVFYSTNDEDGILALQGVSRLITHKNEDNRDTKGTGFLGITEDNNGDTLCRPFINEELRENINQLFIRKEIGTSLFVLGFEANDDWKNSVIDATLDYYLVAIIDGNLEVKVEDTIINKETLQKVITLRNINRDDSLTYNYYESLIYLGVQDGCYKFEENNFEGLGKITLYVYIKKDLPKKIALVRGMGMKIIDKSFRLTNNFAGVLKIEGKNINMFIRSLENPSHDKIEPERAEDIKYAKRIINKLNDWMKGCIKSIEEDDGKEILDIDVVGQYLPDIDSLGNVELEIKEKLDRKVKKVGIKESKKPKRCVKPTKITVDSDEGNGDGEERNPSGNSGGENSGDKGVKKPQNSQERSGNETQNKKTKPIELEKSRVFCIDKSIGKYRLIIASKNRSNALFQLRIIGEDGFDIAKIKSVEEVNGDIVLNSETTFGPIFFNKGEKKSFNVIIDKPLKYSMEVIANVNDI